MRGPWLLAGLAVALLPTPARADGDDDASALVRARAHLAAVELDLAGQALDEALRSGDNGPAELAEIYLLSGRVAAALGKTERAVDQFTRLLVIDPSAALPPGLAPKIVAPFEAARRKAKTPLRLRAELRPGAEPVLVVNVESDPLALIAGARAVVSAASGGEQTVAVAAAREMTLRLPRDRATRIALSIVDARGNRLAEARFAGNAGQGDSRMSADVVRSSDATRPSPEPPTTPIYARWYLWAGASALMIAGGTYFAIAANDTADQLDRWDTESGTHDASAALELDARGRRQTILANVGFAAAAVTAGVAGWLIWRGTRSPPPASVSASAGDSGAAIAVGLRF